MSPFWAKVILLASFGSMAFGQSPSVSPPQTSPPQPAAPLPPSPPDMAIPDPGSFPRHSDKTKSPTKRVADRLTPVCLDWIFHSCWASGNGDLPSDADLKFDKNFAVGDSYFKERNYRGAESRLREALEYKPHDPETTYKLAVSVDKLGKIDEARELYEAYLKLAPGGVYAERARKALRKIEKPGNPAR